MIQLVARRVFFLTRGKLSEPKFDAYNSDKRFTKGTKLKELTVFGYVTYTTVKSSK